MPLSPLHIETPLLRTAADYSASGLPLWLKLDALQPSGSFKLRGVGLLCQHEVAKGAKEIFCASGGNAGIAAAVAGKALGVPVTIVVPETTSAEVRARIAATGAKVLVHGSVFDEANAHAVALATERKAAYVHPYDHPLLWEGHATLIDEVVKAGAEFDCVVTSVGGGGLLPATLALVADLYPPRGEVPTDAPVLVCCGGAGGHRIQLHRGTLPQDVACAIALDLGAVTLPAQKAHRSGALAGWLSAQRFAGQDHLCAVAN